MENAIEDPVKEILQRHEAVFSPELGKLKGITANIAVNAGSTPRYIKARTVPLARRAKVDEALEKLQRDNVIRAVPHSDWAAPIVAPGKPDGSVRVRGDFKTTVNAVLGVDKYPLPRIDEIFANLNGGQKFSVLDLKTAYLQMELEDSSKKFMTVNTRRGLFEYQRLPFGVQCTHA